jgi:hypothetical protein
VNGGTGFSKMSCKIELVGPRGIEPLTYAAIAFVRDIAAELDFAHVSARGRSHEIFKLLI